MNCIQSKIPHLIDFERYSMIADIGYKNILRPQYLWGLHFMDYKKSVKRVQNRTIDLFWSLNE